MPATKQGLHRSLCPAPPCGMRTSSGSSKRPLIKDAEADTLAEQEPLLAALSAASIQGQLATGPRAGHRVRRLLSDPIEGLRGGPLCFSARGFSLHAATRIAAEDRAGLERLCRYVTRPPLAVGRLQLIDADHLTFIRQDLR